MDGMRLQGTEKIAEKQRPVKKERKKETKRENQKQAKEGGKQRDRDFRETKEAMV